MAGIVMSAVLAGTAAGAEASSFTGKVAEIHVRTSDGLQWVVMAGIPSGRPACAATQRYYMIRDEHSDAGKAQFAMLLSAQLGGRTVTVEGAGACTRWGDGEDIEGVAIAP